MERQTLVDALTVVSELLKDNALEEVNFPTMNPREVSLSDLNILDRIFAVTETITHQDPTTPEKINLRTTTAGELSLLVRYIADMMQD